MPIRVLIVTGTPYRAAARTVAVKIIRSRSRLYGSAAPPPLRVTLGTGQPKFRVDMIDAVLVAQDFGRAAP